MCERLRTTNTSLTNDNSTDVGSSIRFNVSVQLRNQRPHLGRTAPVTRPGLNLFIGYFEVDLHDVRLSSITSADFDCMDLPSSGYKVAFIGGPCFGTRPSKLHRKNSVAVWMYRSCQSVRRCRPHRKEHNGTGNF